MIRRRGSHPESWRRIHRFVRDGLLACLIASVVLVPQAAGAAPNSIVLGRVYESGLAGFATAHPATVALGWNATSQFTGLRWTAWGAPEAVGHGEALFSPPGQPQSASVMRALEIVAFNLGTCGGHVAYRAMEYFFPGEGQHFDPLNYIDICYGSVVSAKNLGAGNCQLISLVRSADDYEIAHANIDGNNRVVLDFACYRGFADVFFASDYTHEMLFQQSRNATGWRVILVRGAQGVQSSTPGIPPAVYRELFKLMRPNQGPVHTWGYF